MKPGILKTAALAGLLAGLAALPTRSQDASEDAARIRAEIAKIKKEITRAEADLGRTDSLTRAEQAASAKSLERWQKDRERRQKENQDMNASLAETRAKTAAERGRQQGYQNGIQEIQAREKALMQYLAGMADSLLRRIQAGLPWDLEARQERLLALKRDVDAGSASPEEALSRLTAVLKEEVKSGDEIALFNRPMTRQSGEMVNAQILKLGNRALLYMDDEEKKFGILEPRWDHGKVAYAWREDLSFVEKNSVKRALAVKTGRETPQLVPLSLALSLDSAAAGKAGR